jgi:bifunctional ADP-heptose synthase (sugar kinase/adenylyltransferase)
VFTSGDVVFSSTALISAMHRAMLPLQPMLGHMQAKYGLDAAAINRLLDGMQGQPVLVIGEVIFDTYVFCDQPNVAGEGPMLSLRPLEYRSFDGGAAIIAKHLAALGARPTLLTALPDTPQVESFLHRMAMDGIDVCHIHTTRNVMEKQRFLVGTNKVMKLDIGDPMVLDDQQRRTLLDLANQRAADARGFMLADYGLGLLTPVIIRQLCAALRSRVDIMVGDVSARRSSLLAMQSMDVILPTELELRQSVNEFDEGLTSVVWNVLDRTNSRSAIVTLGDGGLIAFDRRQDVARQEDHFGSRLHAEPIPALTTHAVDQLGCGDALSAAVVLAMLAGGDLPAAAFIGSMAGAAQAQQMGNVTIGTRQLRQVAERVLDASLAWQPQAIRTMRGDPSDQLPVSNP